MHERHILQAQWACLHRMSGKGDTSRGCLQIQQSCGKHPTPMFSNPCLVANPRSESKSPSVQIGNQFWMTVARPTIFGSRLTPGKVGGYKQATAALAGQWGRCCRRLDLSFARPTLRSTRSTAAFWVGVFCVASIRKYSGISIEAVCTVKH